MRIGLGILSAVFADRKPTQFQAFGAGRKIVWVLVWRSATPCWDRSNFAQHSTINRLFSTDCAKKLRRALNFSQKFGRNKSCYAENPYCQIRHLAVWRSEHAYLQMHRGFRRFYPPARSLLFFCLGGAPFAFCADYSSPSDLNLFEVLAYIPATPVCASLYPLCLGWAPNRSLRSQPP